MAYPDYVIDLIAHVAHNANAAFQEHLGDFTPVPWSELDEHTKNSAYNGVLIHLNNPHLTPRESHENWRSFKNKNGWVYGETKDLDAKTHPNMVPYEQLPEAQRTKDYLFKNIVAAFAAGIQNCEEYAPGSGGGIAELNAEQQAALAAGGDEGKQSTSESTGEEESQSSTTLDTDTQTGEQSGEETEESLLEQDENGSTDEESDEEEDLGV